MARADSAQRGLGSHGHCALGGAPSEPPEPGSSPKAPMSAPQWDGERRNAQITALVCPSWEGEVSGGLAALQVPPQAGNSPQDEPGCSPCPWGAGWEEAAEGA